jgi:hypothetical protein
LLGGMGLSFFIHVSYIHNEYIYKVLLEKICAMVLSKTIERQKCKRVQTPSQCKKAK